MKKIALAAALALTAFSGAASAEVVRHTTPGSTFPILRAVEIPADATLVYLSGVVPGVADESADRATAAAWGNTQVQTESVLTRITSNLEAIGLTMSDVVKMQVYLVADESGSMDFNGFMDGYVKFFGTEAQPNLPTRSVFEVAGLANKNWLVEIEVVAVRP